MTAYIDTHVHLWDTEGASYPWLNEVEELPRRASLSDYRAATAGDPPQQFVFVQADAADGVAEARWVAQVCEDQPDLGGLVVWAPVDDGPDAVAAHLDALAVDRIVGVRRLIQGEPSGLCTSPSFIEAVRVLGDRDLAFDVCITPDQLDDVRRFAESVPGSRLVIDHLAKPDIAAAGLDEWRAGFAPLGDLDHVWCKLSGLVTEADHESWTVENLAPYVEVALESFGPGRMLWGSDWPVCTLAASHRRWREATEQLLAPLTDSERQAVLVDSARDVYRLR